MTYRIPIVVLLVSTSGLLRAQDVYEANEKKLQQASAAVAPCLARIETSGGAEVVGGPSVQAGGFRKGTGPTTGLVIAPDGYLITSSFNFANKPTEIFVSVPGRPRAVAKVVATDSTRMLTLLKIDATGLPVPTVYPVNDLKIGQWSVATGRALSPDLAGPPSMSIGIVSAVGRIQGKAIQTDAKVSPVNYGGALVAADGRVMGVLVPLSPRGDSDTAGVEWYDSGIGFAVPLADVMAAFPRMKAGENLTRGILGVTFKNGAEPYFEPPTIDVVTPETAAARLGLQSGDRIVELDGKPIPHITALQFALGPKYAGDIVSLKIDRSGQPLAFDKVQLTANLSTYIQPFLGLLPMRDDPEAGVLVRSVFPNSPAEKAGIKAGERILRIAPPSGARPRGPGPGALPAMLPIQNRTHLATMLLGYSPNTDVKLDVKGTDGKTRSVTAKLGILTDELPPIAPLPSTVGKALEKPKRPEGAPPMPPMPEPKKEDAKKNEPKKDKDEEKKEPETGKLLRTNPALGREYWLFVPKNYTPNVSHGIILWLHEPDRANKDADDLIKTWESFCEDNHFLLIGPKSQSGTGWVASETEGIVQDVNEVIKSYTIDRTRVVAHGIGVGGQMAYYLGFNARNLIRGVAVSAAPLGTQPKDNVPNEPLAFFIVGGDKDPAIKEIRESRPKLVEKRFPVVYRELADFGKQYLDQKTFEELQRWLDSLDRI